MAVFVVEDERLLADAIGSFLSRWREWEVRVFYDGTSLLESLEKDPFGVAVLDWKLSDGDSAPNGLDLCKALRRRAAHVGVVFLTARSLKDDKLLAFKAGADDYVTKPFEPDELAARIAAVGRRLDIGGTESRHGRETPEGRPQNIAYGGVSVDCLEQVVQVRGIEVDLPRKQFLLLVYLLRNAGRPVSHRELRERVLRTVAEQDSSSIRNHVKELRARLGLEGHIIESVRGLGYGVAVSSEFRAQDTPFER